MRRSGLLSIRNVNFSQVKPLQILWVLIGGPDIEDIKEQPPKVSTSQPQGEELTIRLDLNDGLLLPIAIAVSSRVAFVQSHHSSPYQAPASIRIYELERSWRNLPQTLDKDTFLVRTEPRRAMHKLDGGFCYTPADA